MLGRLGAIIEYFNERGLRPTLAKIAVHLLSLPAGLIFAVYDWVTTHDRQDVTISIPGSQPESDTYALLDTLSERQEPGQLTVLSYKTVDTSQLDLWEDITVRTPRHHTLSCFRALARSDVVLCKHDSHLKWYRMFDTSDRTYVRSYHGPITKAYGATRTESQPTYHSMVPRPDTTIKLRVVNSDTERYFRASAEGRHPQRFRKWGYPRFDRLWRFVDGDATPVLPPSTCETLATEDSTTDILYAPTHKDRDYVTTFVPYPNADPERLQAWCHENNVRLFLRPHPGESPRMDHLVDSETILLADQSIASAATELLPHMDGLITDYSSIYVEFLPFNRPIVFVPDNHERFCEIRGLAFDYERYFPGPKPQTFSDFLAALEQVVTGEDGYADERGFVRETFTPRTEYSFLNAVRKAEGLGESAHDE